MVFYNEHSEMYDDEYLTKHLERKKSINMRPIAISVGTSDK